MSLEQDTIVAPATGSGGAVAVIRLSGPDAIAIADSIFVKRGGGKLSGQPGFTMHYGDIMLDGKPLDDVIVSLFKAPKSYTGEDMVEISCHASPYIKSTIIDLCIRHGARSAAAGEFTMRAFMSGKMDLAQSEAVADVIAADSKAAHTIAARQLRGGYSSDFSALRDKLLELASLLELELDFSEEDVQFADRAKLETILRDAERRIKTLLESFRLGNIVKSGVPVAIVGKPNVGKSTLLNTLLNEEKALVSDIAGTTRDTIEDTVNITGITFRFIDTAGIRHSTDPIEKMGIERTRQSIARASVVLLVADISAGAKDIAAQLSALQIGREQQAAVILSKADKYTPAESERLIIELENLGIQNVIAVSAKEKRNIEAINKFLLSSISAVGIFDNDDTIVFNLRHQQCLALALEAVKRAKTGMETNLATDLLSEEVNQIIHHVSLVTGDITSQDILNSVFSRFCIGK